ncbi:hypothetical protein ACVINW_001405 [Bradyrhizobium sp. USDA 4461]
MTASSLLQFFQAGAVSAGFVFLVPVFRLIRDEIQPGPTGRRRPVRLKAIASIFLFAIVSLTFFLTGVYAQNLAPDPFLDYETLEMGHYGFDTTTNPVKFQMTVARPDTSRYVRKVDASGYDIVLGVREDSQLSLEDRTYDTAIQHMKFATTDMREWNPSAKDLAMFQSKCVRFSIFGISNAEPHSIGSTFNPRDYKTIKLFDTRSTGNHCG